MAIPFDYVQYCPTDEDMVGMATNDVTLEPGESAEHLVGYFNVNPGFSGEIKILTLRTYLEWLNPAQIELNGTVIMKAKQYSDDTWHTLKVHEFNAETGTGSGELIDVSINLISGESSILSNISKVPLIVMITFTVNTEEEQLGEELIINGSFASGEDNWTKYPDQFQTNNGMYTNPTSISNQQMLVGPGNGYLYKSTPFHLKDNTKYKFSAINILPGDFDTLPGGYQTPAAHNSGIAISGELVEKFETKIAKYTNYYDSNYITYTNYQFVQYPIYTEVPYDDSIEMSYQTDRIIATKSTYRTNWVYGEDITEKKFTAYFTPTCYDPSGSGEASLYIRAAASGPGYYIYSGIHHNINYYKDISVKEVTREAGLPSSISFKPRNLIVRCMGDIL